MLEHRWNACVNVEFLDLSLFLFQNIAESGVWFCRIKKYVLPDMSFSGFLRDQPYDLPVWCVVNHGESHIYVGAGPITDILRANELHRMYYVDFENAAVCYREDAPITL